ncbi:MAG: hypothetical protein RL329_1815 [Bacteroidota bacterium]
MLKTMFGGFETLQTLYHIENQHFNQYFFVDSLTSTNYTSCIKIYNLTELQYFLVLPIKQVDTCILHSKDCYITN